MLTDMLAFVLQDLGTERAMVVHGVGGLDEISTFGETRVTELKNGHVTSYIFNPESIGVSLSDVAHVSGGTSEQNAEIIRTIVGGKKGAPRDIAVVNAGAALYVADMAESIGDGVRRAADAIDSGAAKNKLKQLIEYTN
jgi:anthranilate phosphoribosyltransferase